MPRFRRMNTEAAAEPRARVNGYTVLEWKHAYADIVRETASPISVASTIRTFESFVRFIGPKTMLRDVTRQDIGEWIESRRTSPRGRMAKMPTAATVRREYTQLSSVFGAALRSGAIESSPCRALVIAAPEQTKAWTYLDGPTSNRVYEALPSIAARTYFALLRWGGLRHHEAMKLRWEHVDFEHSAMAIEPAMRGNYQRVTTKQRPRVVPLDPRLRGALEAARAKYPHADRPCSNCSNRYADDYLTNMIAGITGLTVRPHALRKACISDWCEVLPVASVAEIAGNSVDVLMERYHKARLQNIQPLLAVLARSQAWNESENATGAGKNLEIDGISIDRVAESPKLSSVPQDSPQVQPETRESPRPV